MSLARTPGQISLWIEREGAGAPLLLIAGLGYASWCWHELRAALRDRCDLVAFDNRGTGRSDKPAGPYTIEMMADDAAAVLDVAGLGSAHVLGHSMGGYIAQALTLKHPRKVRSLILVGTMAGGPGMLPVPPDTLEAWKLAGTLPPAEYARRSMPKSFAPGWTDAHPQEFEAILARRLQFPTPTPCWLAQYQACADFVSRGAPVEEIRVPTTVIHGALDGVVPQPNGRKMAQRIAGARFVDLPQAGHLPYLEDLAGFTALVREHLERAK